MSFKFHFVGARFDQGRQDSLQPGPTLRLFGRLIEGCLRLGDSIVIPTSDGIQVAVVSQFWDSLCDSGLMPFYDEATPELPPFCLVIHDFSQHLSLVCPAMAHSPDYGLAE